MLKIGIYNYNYPGLGKILIENLLSHIEIASPSLPPGVLWEDWNYSEKDDEGPPESEQKQLGCYQDYLRLMIISNFQITRTLAYMINTLARGKVTPV